MKKFTLLMAAALVGMSASAADIYLRGDMNGWGASADWKFTEKSPTEYVLEGKEVSYTQSFKVADDAWGTINYGGADNIEFGKEYTLSYNSSVNCKLKESSTNATFTFNLETKVLTVTGESGDVELSYDFGIHGDIFGNPAWSTEKMTESDGKYVLADKECVAGNFGIKLLTPGTDSQAGWWNSKGAAAVVLDTPMTVGNDGTNFSIAAGTYTFTLDPKAMTLTVTGKSGGDDPAEQWYIIGKDFGEWNVDDEMTKNDDGTWSWTGNLTGAFKFRNAKNWEDGTTVLGSATNIGKVNNEENPEVITEDGTVGLSNNRDAQNLSINGESVTLVLDPKALTLKVSGLATTGVAAVEAANGEAVYFNMQGVRVANPENGLFIRVQNGKAVKVVK